jgi:hypothetical protein
VDAMDRRRVGGAFRANGPVGGLQPDEPTTDAGGGRPPDAGLPDGDQWVPMGSANV